MIKEHVIIKKDLKQNWDKAKNFIPKDGEIIQYIDTKQIKIGNGKNKLCELKFLTQYQYNIENDMLIIEEG